MQAPRKISPPLPRLKESDRRGSRHERGYDSRWTRLRIIHLKLHPLCCECERAGYVKPAELVDHILPINDGGDPLDPENLQSLCRRHHGEKTAKDIAARRGY